MNGFFDYDEALAMPAKCIKPLFVDYTGHGCVNCREMEARVWADPQVLQLLRNDFVIVALYSDDKKELPENEWVTAETGRVLKSIGKINAYLAHKRFGINSQPYYMILGPDGEQLPQGRGYNLDVDQFVAFLRQGLRNYPVGAGSPNARYGRELRGWRFCAVILRIWKDFLPLQTKKWAFVLRKPICVCGVFPLRGRASVVLKSRAHSSVG